MSSEPPNDDPVLASLRRLEVLVMLNGRPRTLLTMGGAAESMGLSLSSFERYVKPTVPFVQIGTKKMYRPKDLERWCDAQVQDQRHRAPRA